MMMMMLIIVRKVPRCFTTNTTVDGVMNGLILIMAKKQPRARMVFYDDTRTTGAAYDVKDRVARDDDDVDVDRRGRGCRNI